MRLPLGAVAGVDLSLQRAEEADQAGRFIADGIARQGVDIERVLVGVHRIVVDEGSEATVSAAAVNNFSISVGIHGLDPHEVWRTVLGAAAQASWPVEPTVVMRGRHRGPQGRAEFARAAASAQANGTGGRAVVFRGSSRLRGSWRVADLVEHTAIEQVVDIEESNPHGDDLVFVTDTLRPRWSFGKLVLFVLPAAGLPDSVYLPFQEQQLVDA